MPIVYSLVARQKVVFAEFTSSSGNFPTVTRVLLAKIPENDTKMSYEYDEWVFHYVVDQGITFLCMADAHSKRRTTFAFLEDIKRSWRERFAAVEQSAIAFQMNETFSPILHERMDYYNENPTANDNIGKVQTQIESVKSVMHANIDQILERGEKIELLVDKTERLNQQAFVFERSAKSLKSAMFWKKVRLFFLGLGVVLVIAGVIAGAVCGGGGCGSSK